MIKKVERYCLKWLKKTEIYGVFGLVVAAFLIGIILVATGTYGFGESLRAVFGLVYVLFLPGYFVVRCFYDREGLDWIEKLGLSVGLSIALVILLILITNLGLHIPIVAWANFLVILVLLIIIVLLKVYEKQIKDFGLKIKKKFKR